MINTITGKSRWQFTTETANTRSPVIGKNGRVYAGVDSVLLDERKEETKPKLLKINEKTGRITSSFNIDATTPPFPIIADDDMLFLGGEDLNLLSGKTVKNQFPFKVSHSPTIGKFVTIYFGADDNQLYSIKGPSISGPADSPWPMFGQNG